MQATIDIGNGQAWAYPRGTDIAYKRLIQYMHQSILSEFIEMVQSVDYYVPNGLEKQHFQEAYQFLKSVPPRAMRTVMLHPVAIFWVRSTRQTITATIKQKKLDPYWTRHLYTVNQMEENLNLFHHIVLAAAILAGIEVEFDINLYGDTHFSLPGTRIALRLPKDLQHQKHVSAAVKARGTRFQMLLNQVPIIDFELLNGQPQTTNKSVMLTPVLNSLEFNNRDSRFSQNWIQAELFGDNCDTVSLSDEDIPSWQQHFEESFRLLKFCNPLLETEIRSIIRSIVPIKVINSNRLMSCSNRDFWGAIMCSYHPGVTLAEVLAHEYRHNILNAILEFDTIIDESSEQGAIFYSPWRTDRRPLIGLLHAMYSFMEVVGFYQLYLEKYGLGGAEARVAQETIALNILRLQKGAADFEKYAKLTPFGTELFEGMRCRLDDISTQSKQIDSEIVSTMQKQFNQHCQRYDT